MFVGGYIIVYLQNKKINYNLNMIEKYKQQLEELTKEKITFKNRHWQSRSFYYRFEESKNKIVCYAKAQTIQNKELEIK